MPEFTAISVRPGCKVVASHYKGLAYACGRVRCSPHDCSGSPSAAREWVSHQLGSKLLASFLFTVEVVRATNCTGLYRGFYRVKSLWKKTC